MEPVWQSAFIVTRSAPPNLPDEIDRMISFEDENVLQYAVESFAETVALKVKQLRRFVPKEKARTNTDVTGAYIEELVRGFVRRWIRDQHLLHGTFYAEYLKDALGKPFQIDGIVHDPTRGPVTLQEGDFVVLHPAFCSAVIEVKMTVPSIDEFEGRLQTIYKLYMHHLPTPHVMGIVVADADPEKTSKCRVIEPPLDYHNYHTVPLCPIFILFTETEDADYKPFYPGIESMIRAIYNNTTITTNYLG
jgi:hypothetical protein